MAGEDAEDLSFKMKYGVAFSTALEEMTADTERRHQELLELISARSASFDTTSSVGCPGFQ